MLKQFVLMFIIIINVSIYPQLVIKAEIILDEKNIYETGIESTGLTTPFYGKAKETLYSSYNIICSKARNELIVDNTYYQFGPCWSWDCGTSGSCFCSSNISQLVENIPMGTFIDIKIQKCSNWDGGTNYYWKVLEHYFEIYSSTSSYKQYKIYSRYDESSQWINVGLIEFWKTTTPPCDESPSCCSDLPFCETFNVPNALYIEKSAGYEACLTEDYCVEINPCSSSNSSCITNGGMAAIDFAPFHLVDGYEWNLQPCTNPLNNKVRFNYSMMHNGSPINQIPVTYVIEWCPNNCIPPKTWIEDEEDLIKKLKAEPEQMCTILNNICNHFGQYPIPAKYLFR